jgi:hypothetical protein
LGCESNNGLIDHIYQQKQEGSLFESPDNLEEVILSMYFKVGTFKPRYRLLSQLKLELKGYDLKEIDRTLRKLENESKLIINSNNSFITQEGMTYFKEIKKN